MFRSNEPKTRLGMAQIGDKVILKGDRDRRVFEVRESEYPGYIDLWRGKYRVVTAAPSQEIEFVTT
jgi:hypothetical protein